MIIKSHIRGGFRSAADYLKEQGENEKIRLVEISDPHAKTLDEAFRAMWSIADGTRAKKPLHHISINPMKDERLTDKQVLRIVERLEEKYGYAKGDHQRVIVEHIKEGRQHFHVMWNRVSLSTGKPIYPYMHKKQSKIAAREMEIELGLKKPVSKRAKFGFFTKTENMRAKSSGRKIEIGLKKLVFHNVKLGFAPRLSSKAGVKSSGSFSPAVSDPHVSTVLRPMMGFRPLARLTVQPMGPSRNPYMTVMRGNSSGMSEEQRLDFIAACEGKITWKQYFQRWGNPRASVGFGM